MERAAVQKTETESKFFDHLSVIRAMESDFLRHGELLPQTHERFYDEEASYWAEAIDAPIAPRHEYLYHQESGDFVDRQGRYFSDILANGVQAAERQAGRNPELEFEYRFAKNDQARHGLLQELMEEDGPNTLIMFAPYPERTAERYGKAVISRLGYQPERKLSFMRIYHRETSEDGQPILAEHCISLDNSSLELLNSLGASISEDFLPASHEVEMQGQSLRLHMQDHEAFTQRIIDHYDTLLGDQTGKNYRQGRRIGQQEETDGWQFVRKNNDLIEHQLQLYADIAALRAGERPQFNVLDRYLMQTVNAAEGNLLPPEYSLAMRRAVENPDTLLNDEAAASIRTAIAYMHIATLKRRHDIAQVEPELKLVSNMPSMREIISSTDHALERMMVMAGCGGVLDMMRQNDIQSLAKEIFAYDRIGECKKCKKENVRCGPCYVCFDCTALDSLRDWQDETAV